LAQSTNTLLATIEKVVGITKKVDKSSAKIVFAVDELEGIKSELA